MTTQATTPEREGVRESPWAPGHRKSHQHLVDSLPAVLETDFSDWQERVDNATARDAKIGPFITHLLPVVAIEYETITEGNRRISRPAGTPDRTYLVTTDHPPEAVNIVRDYLKEQAPDKHFTFCTNRAVCILGRSK